MPGFRSLAANRDFTVLWVGETVNQLGSRVSVFVFPLLAYSLSGSVLVAACVEAAHLLGTAVVLLPAGALADRIDRRVLMLAASGSGALLYASLVVAGLLGTLTIPHLAVVGLLTGVTAGVFGPAQISAVRSVVSTADLATALSQNQARRHVASLLGGPVGGALYSLSRWAPFAFDALTFAISCLTLTRIRTDLSAPPRASRTRVVTDIAEGISFILARPFFRVLMSWAALVNLVTNALTFVVLLRMIQADFPPAQIGLVETAAGIGGILGALAAPYVIDRVPTGALTVGVSWALALPLVPMIWWANPLVVGACSFFFLFLNPIGNAGIGAYRLALTPEHLQGRVTASAQFLAVALMPLAPLLGAALLHRYGGEWAVTVLLAATLALAGYLTASKSVRGVPRPSEWRQQTLAA
ncbi:MFS transporter [uncultured Nocardioides sp.]|uniref:MFS transporter n=1 Tax=uncultured Nocardioides sp. TaxID=198441 RepID=UPI0025DD421D|nr:MFS transporter [uncultured Nocardioides sp.]